MIKKSEAYKLRMSILRSKEIKDLYKQHTEAIDLSLNNIMANISKNFLVKQQNGQEVVNPDVVIEFIKAYMNNTWIYQICFIIMLYNKN